MHDLASLGFCSFFVEQLNIEDFNELIIARIFSEHRKHYEVWTAGSIGSAKLAGKLYNELSEDQLPGVGDWVTLKSPIEANQTGVINRVLKRKTSFTRGSAGLESRGQTIAANVDIVFLVAGLDEDFNIKRIERYLSRIKASGAQPVIILNKADICVDLERKIRELESSSRNAPILAVSALFPEQLDSVRKFVTPGITAAFVGSSGVGKSTLINALLGENRMLTAEVSAFESRGRHTTSHRQVIILPGGGLLLDTPGMRELQLCDDEGIDETFEDIETISKECRFGDCRHVSEPGCAVIEAVESGQLAVSRLDHYRSLKREAENYELRHDERLRHKSERVWGKLSREGVMIRKLKNKS